MDKISLVYEINQQLVAAECVAPWVYPLGIHFLEEQIRWETGKQPKLLSADKI